MELAFSEIWYWLLLASVVSYFIGCFNFALLISKIKHKDVRSIGSGNPGTMNMSRQFGLKIGAITYFCDVFKGGLPVLAAFLIFRGYVFAGTDVLVSDLARYICGVSAIIGHIFPVTMKFKGGKGIASTMGMYWFALSCEYWWMSLVVFAFLWITLFYILISEWGSMGSLFGVSILTIMQGIIFYLRYAGEIANVYVMAVFLILFFDCFLTWFAHRRNIMALLAGEEHRTSVRKHAHKKQNAQQ